MKYHFFMIMLVILVACAKAPSKVEPKQELSPRLAKTKACFLLFDLKRKKYVDVINKERCQERFPACSTFKVPLAVMGFDSGVFKDPSSRPFRWDGEKRMIDSWNRDHTAKTWMHDSVVWYSQELTRKLGRKKVSDYLKKFSYGNEDFSGGLEDAWLTPAPFLSGEPEVSVLISAFEQIEFLKALYLYELPVSLNAMTLTQSILPSEVSPNGAVLTGKTGSGFLDKEFKQRIGWYIAHLKIENEEYLSVLTYHDVEPLTESSFGGGLARESMKEILKEKGLW